MKQKKQYSNAVMVSLMALLLFASQPIFSQSTSVITGRVIDSSNGEAIVGAGVIIRSISKATTTDINGNYRLTGVPVGQHTVEFVMMGYARSQSPLNVTAGVNALNVTLSYSTVNEVVVTAKRVSNTDAALLSKRKKAPVAQDAISAEQISKSPDSDAADAAKRVTGVTIVDGKNVYIRGLGERYSGVTFAGSSLPSPDPDKRIVPLDVFPTALLDNLVIVKANSPSMSGEFAGGIVQINPKDYPDKQLFSVSVGTGFHTNTTFKDFYTYDGGKYDFFGYDDGTRELPSEIGDEAVRPGAYSSDEQKKIGNAFNNEYTPDEKKGILPMSLSMQYGNTYQIGQTSKFGFLASGMFKESSKNKTVDLFRPTDTGDTKLKEQVKKSVYSADSGALFSAGYTNTSHKLRLTTFYSHQAEKSTSVYDGFNADRQEGDVESLEKRYKLSFVEQSLLFNQLSGEHHLIGKISADWMASFSRAKRDEPDTRSVQLIDANSTGNYMLYRADDVTRYFQTHTDDVYEVSPALNFGFKQWSGLDSKLTVGGGYMHRERESRARTFTWKNFGGSGGMYEPIEGLYTSDTIGSADEDGVYYIYETSPSADKYTGKLSVISGFTQVDLPLVSRVRFFGGMRVEKADMDLLVFDPTQGKMTNNEKEPLGDYDLLPALSLTYSPLDDFNIRTAFSKTLARPDFREISEFKQPTSVPGEELLGNPDLKQTDIYNYDLRFEWFPSASEIVALSFFYKHLDAPIEMFEVTSSGGALYKFHNAKSADNYGAEFEARKGLGFVNKSIADFSIGSNLTYVYSQIDIQNNSDATYSSTKRPLQGQSPYIVNLSLAYDNDKSGTAAAVLYNIYGRRIVRVGTVQGDVKRGDIYEEPVGKLDFTLKQRLTTNAGLKFTASNLLDPEIRQTREDKNVSTGKTTEYTLEKTRDGRSFGLSVDLKF